LRRLLFYSGIMLLLVGLTVLIVSASLRNVKKVTVKSELDSWEVSENLTVGNTYIVDIMSSTDWRTDWTDGAYTDPQPVNVTIVSPNGNITKLQAFFLARLSESPLYPSTFPSMVYVEYGEVDSGSIEVDESYPQIRFGVKESGNYSARIIHEINETLGVGWARGRPAEMIIYREVVEGPSYFIAPSGGILCIVGVVISSYGARATKKLEIKKKARFHR